MAELKKLSAEEVAKLDKKDIRVAREAASGEVEGQAYPVRCPHCGTMIHVSPGWYWNCPECGSTFHFDPI